MKHIISDRYLKRDFWIVENLKYVEPHFRLQKAARLINAIAGRSECDLLDIGCGPGTLMSLLRPNVHYSGIDIAIHRSAPNLLQTDFLEGPLTFQGRRFDIAVAQGVFEYIGTHQCQKLLEIRQLLRDGGVFIASYVNFDHREARIYAPYSNVQPFRNFKRALADIFEVRRALPTSHHWHHHEPNRRYMKKIQMHVNVNIPLISRWLAVEYFFVCSAKRSEGH